MASAQHGSASGRPTMRPAWRLLSAVLAVVTLALACDTRSAAPLPTRPEQRADCIGCHLHDFQSTRHPPHEGVRPTRCASCHLETAWSPSRLRHGWALTGAHEAADCFACHVGKPALFEGTPRECVGCHRADFERSAFPGHDKFPLTCADCHGSVAWLPAQRPRPESPAATGAAAHGKTGSASRAAARSATPARTPKRAVAPVSEDAPAPDTLDGTRDVVAAVVPRAVRAQEREHPENKFSIASGSHRDIECLTCHDQGGRMGKANTDCVQCHKRSRYDRKHAGVDAYPLGDAPANFCVTCHARGTVRPISR